MGTCRRPGSGSYALRAILPPYILDNIARNGSTHQRDEALNTQTVDNTFRSLRLAAQFAQAAVRGSALTATAQRIRSIYSAGNVRTLPGTLVRTEGQPASGDVAADEAYAALGATFDFYKQVYGRCSIDAAGLPLIATVHFGRNYNNAQWDGSQMIFGDGDGALFNRFTACLDIVGHELTHGVTEHDAQLQYFQQSGALNESMSDVFGSLVKQYALQQTADQADWLIGSGLFTSAVKGKALRSMAAPGTAFDDPVLGKDPQPADMSGYVSTFDDNGGVHINSSIPNRAFYLAAMQLGGPAWERAGRIWYNTLSNPVLRPSATFQQFAQVTLVVAQQLYNVGSAEANAVRYGWNTVGITI
jgi:Zn-dependent metalloprotease